MARIRDFIRTELTFCIALLAAAVSCFFVPPDAQYAGYFDLRTLALLYCLMVVVAGLRGAGLFSAMAHELCLRASDVRVLGSILVGLCFFSAMFITNDVALLTFVPFAVVVLGMAHEEKALTWVVIMQTVAANLGSMLTPVGNPQNLYIYSYYDMSAADFFACTAPVWLAALAVTAAVCLFVLPRIGVNVMLGEKPELHRRPLVLYSLLFVLCLTVVFRLLDWKLMLAVLVLVLLILDRRMLKKADFVLLLTFVCFFVFSGNLARMDGVRQLLTKLISGHEMLAGALTSQVISNVPAALLLSGFTDKAGALLLGVDIGGLGTPVASLASLISLKLYSHAATADIRAFLLRFFAVNFALLAVLLAFARFVL